MSSQSADQPAPDQAPAPIGLRELPAQPAKPVMPAYTMPSLGPAPAQGPASHAVERAAGPAADDSVIAKDDHVEGTFTSRGTIVVMGTLKGCIEAVRVRIEDGAHVDADIIVDEAIVAGEFTGTLTCRERLEAQASGRINGRVETYRLMLHEGASVEGEMHMISEAPRDASTTIRGSAPLRGDPGSEPKTHGSLPAGAPPPRVPAVSPASSPVVPVPATKAAAVVTPSSPARPAPVIAPASSAKPSSVKLSPGPSAESQTSGTSAVPATQLTVPGLEDPGTPRRSPIAEALRVETLLVAPRTMNTGNRYGGTVTTRPSGATSSGARPRNGMTGF